MTDCWLAAGCRCNKQQQAATVTSAGGPAVCRDTFAACGRVLHHVDIKGCCHAECFESETDKQSSIVSINKDKCNYYK